MISTLVRKVDFWAGVAAGAWALVAFLWEPRLNELVSYEIALAFAAAAMARAGVLARGERPKKGNGAPVNSVDDPTPVEPLSEPKKRLGLFLPFVPPLLLLTGCAGFGGPGLESVVSRIDIGKAIQCAKQPTPGDKARCLGAQALTVGLGAALDQAAFWGVRAIKAASGAGADDLSDRDRRKIAREADAALANLGAELAAAESNQ